MTHSLPDLPLELLLDILEWLLLLGGKANQRSAAYLAQSCRLLRNSDAGKRARYIHALRRWSMSVPDRLPINIEYETQVLETASWPPPAAPPQSDAIRVAGVYAGMLIPDGHANMSYDRHTLGCSNIQAVSSPPFSPLPSPHSTPSGQERSVLFKTIPLRSQVHEMAGDRSGMRCAVIFLDENALKEVLEIWNIRSGICEGTFELDATAGLASYGTVTYMMMSYPYLLIERAELVEVRYIPVQLDVNSELPIVLSIATPEGEKWLALGASLLPPHFLAVISAPTIDNDGVFHMQVNFYLLEPSSSRLVATICLPHNSSGSVNHVSCGADVVPGEEGLVVLSVRGTIYLLSISTLVGILYPPSDAIEARSFGNEWVKSNMKKLRLFTDGEHFTWASVSGWRCVFSLTERRGCDKRGQVLLFLDASPEQCKAHGQRSHFSASCSPRLHERRLVKYLPTTTHVGERNVDFTAQIRGGRLLVQDIEAEVLFIWRL